jgi:hypothetical protein
LSSVKEPDNTLTIEKTVREEEVEYTRAQPEGPNQAVRGEVDCRMDHSTKDENGLFHKRCK